MDTPHVVGVVPVRYGSRRLPGKALAVVDGRPLVAWAWQSVSRVAEIDRSLVATDDARIADWACRDGVPVAMTTSACRNGTERVAEIADRVLGDYFVNVQADQVGLEPEAIGCLIRGLIGHPEWHMATLVTPCGLEAANKSADRVIACVDSRGLAVDFCRGGSPVGADSRGEALKHIGVYAYRRDALVRYIEADPSGEEIERELEQWRALALGWSVGAVRVSSRVRSYDGPSDVSRVA